LYEENLRLEVGCAGQVESAGRITVTRQGQAYLDAMINELVERR
jgi:hypothetical protein